jgi:hypothetical protein
MTLDTHSQNVGATADKIVLSYLFGATSYRKRAIIPVGKPTSEKLPVQISASIDDYEAEEREWNAIVSQPHVRQALRHMAAQARQQYYAGNTEEGGFAID